MFYSGKSKKHVIKYEVGVNIKTGEIAWIFGGVPGSVHDLTIARNSGILNLLDEGELIMADKAYVGQWQFVTPFKRTETQEKVEFNLELGRVREIVEHSLGRIKKFRCLSTKWRHNLNLHHIAFYVVASLINIEFFFSPVKQL